MRTKIGLLNDKTIKIPSWLADQVKFSRGLRGDKRLFPKNQKVFGAVLVICGGKDAKEVQEKYRKLRLFCKKLRGKEF